MKKRRKRKNKLIIIFVLFISIISFMSVAYSLLEEKITIDAVAFLKQKQLEEEYEIEYSLNSWQSDKYVYQFNPLTLKYSGNNNILSWLINIKVPSDTTLDSCWNAICNLNGTTLEIHSNNINGSINPDGQITNFGFQINTSMSNYQLNVESVKFFSNLLDDPNITKITNNLQANYTIQNGWQKDNQFINQYNWTLKNDSSIDLLDWTLVLDKPENAHIEALWGAIYIEKETEIVIIPSNAYLASSSSIDIGMQIALDNKDTEIILKSFTGLGLKC